MRVLLLGATGNLGSRLLPALIQRGHTVCVFVRDSSKLRSGVQADLFSVERGDATNAAEIKAAATRHQCDAIVNAAGNVAIKPWGKRTLPVIVDAVIRAAVEIGQERGTPLRLWAMAGQGLMDIPTQKYMLVNYMYMFPEHRLTLSKLQALPREALNWSILCPGVMYPLGEPSYPPISTSSVDNLAASASVLPDWSEKYLSLPVIGGYLNVFSQVTAYRTALEDNADLIASDLLQGTNSQWLHQKVGTKEKQKAQ